MAEKWSKWGYHSHEKLNSMHHNNWKNALYLHFISVNFAEAHKQRFSIHIFLTNTRVSAMSFYWISLINSSKLISTLQLKSMSYNFRIKNTYWKKIFYSIESEWTSYGTNWHLFCETIEDNFYDAASFIVPLFVEQFLEIMHWV